MIKKISMSVLAASLVVISSASVANDFSTVTRVHFVQDCISLNAGKMNVYESTHKCSCVIDELAKVFTEAEFEDANTGFRFKNLPGDRGAVFGDDTDVQDGISLFQKTHAEAYASCRIRR
ncbi:hypothetical protein N9Y67_02965 [Pseudomonadota bacterium]|nr:hypothetical protein [Pseudomonadota bacterium]